MKRKIIFSIVGAILILSIAITTILLAINNGDNGDDGDDLGGGGSSNNPPVHVHNYEKQITNPTCEKGGFTLYICACKSEYKSDFVDATGHKYTNYISDNNATLEKDGTKTALCDNGCGKSDTIIDEGSKLTETPTITKAQYKVEYYLENVNDDKYSLYDTKTCFEDINKTVTADIEEIEHFECNLDDSTTVGIVNEDGSLVLKVYYDRNKYTVKFFGSGGSLISGLEEQQVKYQASAYAPTYQRNYYEFTGFNKEYNNISEDINVSAEWRAIKYHIIYNLDGGENPASNPTEYTIESLPLTLAPATHKDGRWIGWYTKNGDTYLKVNGITTIIEDLTLYAMFDFGTSGVEYTSNGEEYTVTKYSGTEKSVVIPSKYLGLPVTKISANAFKKSEIESIYGESIKEIGDSAFSGCKLLEKVNFGDEITYIGAFAFSDCEKLKEISLGNNLKVINGRTFKNCISLERIIIPEGVEVIGEGAFVDCINLVEVDIASTVKEIKEGALGGTGLNKVIIPANVLVMGFGVFANCRSLIEICCRIGAKPESWHPLWRYETTENIIWGYTGE